LWFQQVHCLLEDTHPHTSTTEYVTHCPVVTVVTVVPQVLEVYVNDSHLTGRPKVGKATLPLTNIPRDGKLTVSLPLEPVNPGQQAQGEVLLDVSFKVFEDDEQVI
jgi:hypothetical protein